MSKNHRVSIETAKKKYIQIRDLYEVLSNCANLEIDGSPLLELREPTLTKYQRAENIVERHLNRDSRHPLPTVLINNFNDKTGSDLGEVQIVYGPSANEYARSRHALALAVLDTIYFRDGAYRPETEEGRKTIAHELTHVAQHKNRPLADNRTKDELEAEAAESTEEACRPAMREITVRGRKYRLTERQHRALMRQLKLEVEQELEWRRLTAGAEATAQVRKVIVAYRRYLDEREQGRRLWTEE